VIGVVRFVSGPSPGLTATPIVRGLTFLAEADPSGPLYESRVRASGLPPLKGLSVRLRLLIRAIPTPPGPPLGSLPPLGGIFMSACEGYRL